MEIGKAVEVHTRRTSRAARSRWAHATGPREGFEKVGEREDEEEREGQRALDWFKASPRRACAACADQEACGKARVESGQELLAPDSCLLETRQRRPYWSVCLGTFALSASRVGSPQSSRPWPILVIPQRVRSSGLIIVQTAFDR